MFITRIKAKNWKNFRNVDVRLGERAFLVGPNASGKSNLIEAVGLLKAAPKDLTAPIRQGGGVGDWLWKGQDTDSTVEIEVVVYYPQGIMPLRYRLSFTRVGQRMQLVDEAIENERPTSAGEKDVYFFYRYQRGRPVLNVRPVSEAHAGTGEERTRRSLQREDLNLEQSVLSQRKDPDQYPELTYLAEQFARMELYREWGLGRRTPARIPQKADLPEDFLEEDVSNLGLVLNDLQHRAGMKELMLEKLRLFADGISDISTRIHGGTVQVFLHEKGLSQPVPATRLSDGTLRYLCLLVILCHPTPPPLVCIEEPELGLHPDVLHPVAELLIEASRRTQLIVTTHSDVLVSALTEVPESVLVCEHDDTGSHLHRLNKDQLKDWLEKYTLGELWRMGEIGGSRW